VVRRLAPLSISRSVKTYLPARRHSDWRVLAVFEHACDLEAPNGAIVAIVLPEIGDGPLNIVVEGWPGVFATVEPGMPAWIDETVLCLCDLEIRLDEATVWEPRPNWQQLRQSQEQIESRLAHVQTLALRHAPADSLIGGRVTDSPYVATAWEAAQELRDIWGSGWSADGRIEGVAAQLAGLGCGLTPAGDDFLAGVMLRAWLAHPEPQALCWFLFEAAAPRTTKLSVAFLRAVARGKCGVAWHHLFNALQSSAEGELISAVQGVIAHGHTSGADMLAGFLWPR
jgi:hypothetical protein